MIQPKSNRQARQGRALITQHSIPRKQYLWTEARKIALALALVCFAETGVACEPHPSEGQVERGRSSPPDSSALPRGDGSGAALPDGGDTDTRRAEVEPLDPERVIASMGDQQVSLADIDRLIRRRALMGGIPPERLAPDGWERNPYFLWTACDAILQERRLLDEGGRLALLPDLDQLLAAWEAHPALAVYKGDSLDHVEAELREAAGLGVDDVYAMLRAEIVHDRWLEVVLDRVTEDQLRAEYLWRNRTVTIDAVAIPNAPSDGELRAFLAEPATRELIETTYRDHPSRYTRSASADVEYVRVRLPRDASDEQLERARSRIDELRARAVAGAAFNALDLDDAGDPPAESTAIRQRVVERQLPTAFQLVDGEIGPAERDDFGFVFHRVQRRYSAELRPLDEILSREIGSTYLARNHPSARVLAVARELLTAMRSGDEAVVDRLVDESAISRRSIGPVRREDDHHIAGIGRSEALAEAVFSLAEPGQAIAEPVLVESSIYAVRLIERRDPSADDFERDRETFEAELQQIIRSTAWDAFWAEAVAAEPINFEVGDDYFEGEKVE